MQFFTGVLSWHDMEFLAYRAADRQSSASENLSELKPGDLVDYTLFDGPDGEQLKTDLLSSFGQPPYRVIGTFADPATRETRVVLRPTDPSMPAPVVPKSARDLAAYFANPDKIEGLKPEQRVKGLFCLQAKYLRKRSA